MTLRMINARIEDGRWRMAQKPARHPPSSNLHLRIRRSRGAILFAAMWVLVILGSLIIVMARSVQVEATASANRLSAIQADAIERASEQFVLAQVDGAQGDAVSVASIDAEAVPVGDGYFWLLHPDPDDDTQYRFGIVDEASKLNLNRADSPMFQMLPNMSTDMADAIVDWRDPDDTISGNGAESEYYVSLTPRPYNAKNANFESVEELLLVRDFTKDILFGYDLNRNGVLDDYERSLGGGSGLQVSVNSGASDSRGLFNYVTVNSVEPNTTVDGQTRINVNDADTSALQQALSDALGANRATQILNQLAPYYARGRGGNGANGRPVNTGTGGTGTGTAGQQQQILNVFTDMGTFYVASGMKPDEFDKVADKLTASQEKTLTGLINVMTAPRQVLQCLPGLQSGDADLLVAQRGSQSTTASIAWIFTALQPTTAARIAPYLTNRSFVYSADIVAVSGDGRSFKRVRIVVDAQKSPAKIIYRRDLTGWGWPLDRQIQAQMRAGRFGSYSQGTSGSGGRMGGGSGSTVR
jgi:type II secretory pathway component PulK